MAGGYKHLNMVRHKYNWAYCEKCGKRTTHHTPSGLCICPNCEMGLEDTLSDSDMELLQLVKSSRVSKGELKARLSGVKREPVKVYDHRVTGNVKIGIISDTHIGQEKFDEGLFKFAGEVFRREGVKNVYHAGDILEGASGRDGQCFELTHIGFENQIQYAADLFNKYFKGLQVHGIEGNHDLWYKQKNNAGASVGRVLADRVPNFHYLGEMEADVKLGPKCTMKLFHAGDGTAYATSYKMQKLVESLEGGKKPAILVEGHYHKALYMFQRNVHCVEAATLCGQTGWMRGKKIPAHKGFWILDMTLGKKGITSLQPRFYPAYD